MDQILFIATVLRTIFNYACGLFLLKKWYQSKKRYLTDFPLLFALMSISLSTGKILDIYIILNFSGTQSTITFFRIIQLRYLMSAIASMIMLLIIVIIWFKGKEIVQIISMVIYGLMWAALLLFGNSHEQIAKLTSYYAMPLIILLIITFLLIYQQKRLPVFHSLYVAIGTATYLLSALLYPVLMSLDTGEWGLAFLCEIIACVGWFTIAFSFTKKPPYATKQANKINIEHEISA
ncbi:MAG: hypothetical protein ACTSYF_17120 [Promethearchaeota archaeon]